MRISHKRPIRERGDTIVEVLIAIAVVSLILGGAYTTTNRSMQATRSAQERSVALTLAESQIERLNGMMGRPAAPAAELAVSSSVYILPTTDHAFAVTHTVCDFNTSGVANISIETIFHRSM